MTYVKWENEGIQMLTLTLIPTLTLTAGMTYVKWENEGIQMLATVYGIMI